MKLMFFTGKGNPYTLYWTKVIFRNRDAQFSNTEYESIYST